MSIQAVLKAASKLDKADLAFCISELQAMLATAPAPPPEKALLAPGEHLEEKVLTGKDGQVYTYVHLRWYERNKDGSYSHKSRPVFKGSKAAYLAHKLGTDR